MNLFTYNFLLLISLILFNIQQITTLYREPIKYKEINNIREVASIKYKKLNKCRDYEN